MWSMTSAPSLRRQLSGNKLWSVLLLAALIMGAGCTASKQAKKGPQPKDDTETSDVPRIFNPVTGKYEPVEDPGALIDTVEFRENTETEPVGVVDKPATEKKQVYHLAMLLPLNAKYQGAFFEGIDPRLRRFIHYYAGARMAIQDLNARGIRLETEVLDCGESLESTKQILRELKDPDVIIGPYEMESLQEAAAFALKEHVPVFSPWTPSIPVQKHNPYFVQLNPGLEAHVEAIVDYIDLYLSDSKVYTVARDDARERSRLELFHAEHMEHSGLPPYEDLIITDVSADLNETPLGEILSKDSATVFILPHYSRTDEDFVSAFLRKLHAEKSGATVYVFGMPQWLTFGKLRPDYMESTNVHVSSAHYIDLRDTTILSFQRRFLESYGTIAEPAALQAYSFIEFLGESLNTYGTGFLDEISKRSNSSDYTIQPVYLTDDQEILRPVLYYENRAVHILKSQDHVFRRIE